MDDVSEKSRKKNKVKREKIETIDGRKAVHSNKFLLSYRIRGGIRITRIWL
mgnify:CR=1 FL=1